MIHPRRSVLSVALSALLAAVGTVASLDAASTNVVVRDTWQDATRTDPASPVYAENNGVLGTDADTDGDLESAWFNAGTGATLVPSQGHLLATVPSGSQSITTYFAPPDAPVTLTNVGDAMKITWVFTLSGVGALNSSQNFRLAIVKSPNAARLASDSAPGSAIYAGYAMFGNMGVTLGRGTGDNFDIMRWSAAGSANNLLSTSGAYTKIAGDNSTNGKSGYEAGVPYTYTFTAQRTDTGLQLTQTITGGTLLNNGTGVLTSSILDTTPGTYSFDTFAQRPAGATTTAATFDTTLFKVEYINALMPGITTQPATQTASTGTDATFTVVADGAATLAYQWQKKPAGGDFADIVGATSSTYTITGVQSTDAADYRVVVTNSSGTATSDVATLNVTASDAAPAISADPESATILVGGSNTFSVTAVSVAPPTYQWRYSADGSAYADISGATAPTYTISSAQLSDAGYYRVVVTNPTGSTPSAAATLTVNQAPAFTTQPVGGNLNAGDSLTLTAAASGTPAPTYQWKLNNVIIAGATDATYTITGASGASAGNYTVVATNAVSSVTSSTASVNVLAPSLAVASTFPANAASGVFPDRPLSITFNQAIAAGLSGTIKIYDAANASTPVDTISFASAAARVGNTSVAALPVQSQTIGGQAGLNYYPVTISGSSLKIFPRNGSLTYGKSYYVTIDEGAILDGTGAAFGGIGSNSAWTFSTQAAGPAPGTTLLTVAADGTGDFCTVQGALDFIPAANTTPTTIYIKDGTYTELISWINKSNLTFVGQSRAGVVVGYANNNNFNPTGTAWRAAFSCRGTSTGLVLTNLTLKNFTPKTGSQAETIYLSGSATGMQAILTGVNLISYQDTLLINGQAYISDSYIEGDTDFMWGNGPVYFVNCELKAMSIQSYYTQVRNPATNHGFVYVNCKFSAAATDSQNPANPVSGCYLGRLDQNANPHTEMVLLNCTLGDHLLPVGWNANGQSVPAGTALTNCTEYNSRKISDNSPVDVSQRASWSYQWTSPANDTDIAHFTDPVWVLNTSMSGTSTTSWSPALAPMILAQPAGASLNSGASATFTVAVSAIPAATYQWKKNGADIAGATSASYTIASVTGTDAADYSVVVTNTAGTATSAAATLAVTAIPPTVSVQPKANQAVVSGSGQPVTFSVTATDSGTITYQWQKDGVDIVGATSATYTIANPGTSDSGVYTVVVTGANGSVTSSAGRLAVAAPGGLAWQSYDQTGARLSAAAASFNPETGTYTFTIAANSTVTLVTSSFQPLVLTKPVSGNNTLPVTFSMLASGGYGTNGSVSFKYTGFGLFNDGGTAAGAMGNFTDDKGLWIEFYQSTGAVSMKPQSVTSGVPFCPVSLFQSDINTPYGMGTGTGGALGTINDNMLVDMIVRPASASSGSVTLGTNSNSVAVSGGVLLDHATTGTVLNRRVYSSASSGLSVASAAITFNEFGYHFQNSTGSAVTLQLSNFAGLVVAPYFVIQPAATATVTTGDSLTLSTTAAGNPTAYQWQFSADGSSYTNLDTVANASAATANLTLPNVQSAQAGSYRLLLTNAGGTTASVPTAVSVTAIPFTPIIEVQPIGRTVIPGTATALRVVASGTSPLTYQWKKDGTDVVGATSDTLSFASAAITDSGVYTVLLTNGQGSTLSDPATLNVPQPPIISAQPGDATVALGAAINLAVTATGSPAPDYQWKKNGVAIPGATSATYSIASASAADAGNYTVVITNSAGTATSSLAAVNVLSPALAVTAMAPAAIATGVFPDAPLTLTFNQAVTAGISGRIKIYDSANPTTPVDTIDFTAAAPRLATAALQAVPVQTQTIGTLAGFSYYPVTVSGSTATIHPRNLTLTYGKTYYVTIDAGAFLDSSGQTYAGISDPNAWRFTTRAAPAAGAATYTVATDGSGDFASVQAALDYIPANSTTPTTLFIKAGTYTEIVYWTAKNNLTIKGESRTGTIVGYPNNNTLNPQGTNGRAAFEGRNSTGTVLTNLTVKNFTPLGGTQAEALYFNNADNSQTTILGVNLSSYQDTLNVNGPTYVANTYIEGDTDFMWGNGPVFFENCELHMRSSTTFFTQVRNPATNHGFVYLNCLFSAADGVTGAYLGRLNQNAPAYTEVVLINSREDDDMLNPLGWDLNTNTVQQALDNTLVVEYNVTAQTAGTPVSLAGRVSWAKTWDATANATAIANYSNVTWVLNTQKDGTAKSTPTTWTPALTPMIITQPSAVTTTAGSAVTLTVDATGIPTALTYQWSKDGTPIADATGATYTVATSATTDSGSYTVTVTNTAGNIVSAAAAVTVNATPPVAPVTSAATSVTTTGFTANWAAVSGATGYRLDVSTDSAFGSFVSGYQDIDAGAVLTLPVTGLTAGTTYYYRVRAYGTAGTGASSNTTTVTTTAVTPTATISIVNTGTTAGRTYALNSAAYTQNFDTLPTSAFAWANDSTLAGWSAMSTAGTFDAAAVVTDGSANLADLKIASVGTTASTDRALAYQTRLNSAPTYLGLAFTNASGRELNAFTLSYTPEQWREGTNQRTLTFTVQYRVGASASDLNATSGWTTISGLGATTLNGSATATSTLTATAVTVSVPNGSTIWFRWVTANDAITATSSQDTLAVDNVSVAFAAAPDGSPLITAQPQAQSVNLGTGIPTDITFSVTATGDATLTYQWSKDGNAIGGATNASLTITGVQDSDAGVYTVTVTNGKGSATSSAAVLTITNVVQAPVITVQPQSQTVDAGSSVTFSVTATGGAPLNYQWSKNGTPIANALAPSYTIENVALADAAGYTVAVTNSAGSVTSSTAVLGLTGTVTAPVITAQSGSQSVYVGGTVAFSVTAAGTEPFTYQWRKDGNAIDGATTPSLSLSNVALTDAGDYTVAVTNAGGTAVSTPATLTVLPPPDGSDSAIFVSPAGGASDPGTFAQPTTLVRAIALVPPGGTIYMRGGTYVINVEIDIARGNNGAAGSPKRLFAYTPPGGSVETPVLDFSTQPYGNPSSVSNPRGLWLGGDYWHLRGLEVMGSADNGIYVVGNHNIVELCHLHHNRDTGLQIGRYSSAAPRNEWPSYNLILNCESNDNNDVAPGTGENADGFAAKLTSGPGNVFRGCISHNNIDDGWDLFTKSETGPIDPVVIDQCISYSNGTLSDGTQNPAGDKNGFKLGGEDIAVAHYVSRNIAFNNGKNGFTWNSNPGAIVLVNNLAFDNTEGNFKFDSGSATFYNNVSIWTSSTGPGNRTGINDRYAGASGAPTGASNVFWFKDSSSRGPSINDSGLTAYKTSFVTLTVPVGGFTRNADGSVNLGDFARPVGGSVLLNAGVLPPTDVLAALPYDASAYYEDAPDVGAMETYLHTAPTFLTSPATQSVTTGSAVTFSVSVAGTTPITLQWNKDGSPIGGATSAAYTIAAAQVSDAGSYTVTATNSVSTATSSAGVLTVAAPSAPTITTQPQAQTVTAGDAVSFTVVAAGTAPLSYQWSKDGTPLSGATSATFTIGSTLLSDAGSYTVTVTNNSGNVTSSAAVLTVNAAPDSPAAAAATNVTSSGFTASWSATSGAIGYRLDVSTTSDFTSFLAGYQNLDVGTNLSRAISGLTSGTGYSYRVRAVYAGATSPSSNVISVVTSGAASTTVDASLLSWYKSRSADSVSANTGAHSVTFTENQTSASLFVAHLPAPVTLAVGQKLTVSFTLQTGATLPGTANAMRIGIYGTNGTVIAANPVGDADNAFLNDTGYMASYTLNTGTGSLYGRTPGGTNTQLMGTTGQYTSLGSVSPSGTAAAYAPSTSYAVTFVISRFASATDVSFTVNGGAASNYLLTSSDTASGSLGTGSFDEFAVRVAGGSNSLNSVTLSGLAYSLEAATATAPAILTQPVGQTVLLGGAATFSVSAYGTGPLTYQWQKDGSDIPTATAATYGIATAQSSDAGDYRVVVTNGVSSVTSAVANLTVGAAQPPVITAQPQAQTVNDGGNVTFSVTATGSAPLGYQWSKDGSPISNATAATLTLSGVTSASAGSYTVAVTNSVTTVTSSAAVLTVTPVAPSITTQPLAQSIVQGGNVTFTVVASGTAPLSYQWLKNGNAIGGATAASYTIDGVQSSDAADYSVTVTNSVSSVTSSAATLTVTTPQAPAITTQPQSQTVNDGGNVTFSVTATGSVPLTYQWSKDGSPITNATASSLALTGVSPASAGSYTVVVTNTVSSATSNAAVLTVTPVAPVITAQPQPQTVAAGATAVFSVTATGTAPLSYQWKQDGNVLSGATGATLSVANVQSANTGAYTVTVTNTAGSVTSSAATLSLNTGLAFTAYNLAGFATVGTGTTGGGVIAETDAAYRKVSTPQEFVQAVIDSNKTAGKVKVIEIMNDLNLGWNEVGATVQNLASNPLRSHATPKLHPTLIASGVSVLDIKAKSPLTIFSTSGATIKHVNFNIKGTSNIIIRNLKFDEMWEWDEASKGNYDSNDWDFITVSNGGDVSNIWIDHCTFTKAYDGIVDLKAGTTNATLSWCRYIGDDGATNPNSPVRIQLAALEANRSSYPFYNFLRTNGYSVDDIAQIIQGHDKGHLMGSNSLKAENDSLTATFHHNWMKNVWDRAVPRLRGGNVHDYNIFIDDTDALIAKRLRDTKANLLSTALRNTLNNTYSFNPPLNGAISTEGGAILVEKSIYKDCLWPLRNNQTDPSSAIYTGKIKALDTIYSFLNTDSSRTIVRGDSTDAGNPMGPFQATVIPFAWDLSGGVLPYTYTMDDPAQLESILATGAGAGAVTWSKDNWLRTSYVADTNLAPAVTSQPQTQSIASGADATFTVQASGSPTLTYQWKKDGNALTDGGRVSGSTSAVLVIATATSADNGSYSVTVTNSVGNVTSNAAVLTVVTATQPVIATPPQSQTANAGTDVEFSVVATGTGPFNYQWKKDGTDLVGETGDSLTLTAVQSAAAGSYSVVVTNTAGSVTSSAATLTVNPAVVPPATPSVADASKIGADAFTANWASVNGATGYRLDVSASSVFDTFLSGYQDLDVGNVLSRAVTGLTSGTPYYYRLRAYNADATSASSGTATLTTSGSSTVAIDVSQLTWFQSRTADSIATNTSAQTVTFTEGQASASQYVTYLPGAVSLAVGQTLTLTATFQTGATVSDSTNALRFGLFNANGTRITASANTETNAAVNDDAGYMATYNLGAGTGSLLGRIPGSGNSTLMGSTGSGLYLSAGTTNPSGTTAGFAPSTTYTLTYTVSRLANATLFWAKLNGGSISNYLLTGYDSSTPSVANGTYDEFSVRVAGGTGGLSSLTLSDLAVSVGAYVPSTDLPVITMQPSDQSGLAGASATFNVSAKGIAPLTYQWQKDGADIPGATSATLSFATLAGSDNGTYAVVVTNLAGSVTSTGATLTINTAPAITMQPQSQTVTVGDNVTFTAAASGTPAPTYQWKKDGNAINGATNATLTLTNVQLADAGSYTVVATNSVDSAESSAASLTVNSAPANIAPAITTQPQSQTVTAGATVTFTAAASGNPAPTFQWKKNGTAITGATDVTLTLTNVQSADAATYTVVATNVVSSTESTAATLTVNIAPAITTQPQSQVVTAGATVTFTATASGSPAPTFQWKKNGTAITGANSASLPLANVQSADAATYTVVATNVAGSVESSAATLTVNQPVPAPVVTSAAAASGRVGDAFTYTIIASNSPTSYAASGVPGLTVNPATGLVSGTPTQQGTYTLSVSATNATGTSAVLAVQVTIAPAAAAPVITSSTSATATVGTAFSYQIAATNTPTSFGAAGLPAGLSVNDAGLISGTPTAAGDFPITLGASNASGLGSGVLQLKVVPGLSAPTITSSGSASGQVGVAFAYAAKASNTPTSFVASGLPPGLSINATTGVISGTPTVAGTFSVTLTAANAAGSGATFTLTLTIAATAQAPVVTSDATAIGTQGAAFSYQITATNGPLTAYAATGLPAGLSVNTTTGVISGTPTAVASTTVAITASNASATSTPLSLLITIQAAAETPVVTSSLTAGATQGQPFSYTITASHEPASFAASGLPAGLALNPANGVISGTPTVLGAFNVALTATNGTGTSAVRTLVLTVNPAPDAPVITSGDTAAATAGTAFTYQITASGSPTLFDATSRPAWLAIDTASGLLSGTPTAPGNYTAKLTASSAAGTSATVTLSITVSPAAGSPVITSTLAASGTANAAFSYQLGAGPGPITAYAVGTALPGGLSLDSVTGVIGGTPNTPGTYSIPVSATNAAGIGAAKTLVVTIEAAAGSPGIGTGTGPSSDSRRAAGVGATLGTSGTVGSPFVYQIVASNSPTSYAATGLPAGLVLNPATGVISGLPAVAGTFTAQISAANSVGLGFPVPLVITIAPPALAPVITSVLTASGTAGQALAYQAAASNTPTSFNAAGLPSGLTFDAPTGAISGSPGTPGTYAVVLSANNASGTGAQATLVLTIAPAAGTPAISSSASAVGTVGAAFTYQVVASDTPTSYLASGLAAGLTLNATTGAITGTPVTDGQFSVTIRANNATGASAPFTLTLTIAPSAATSVINSAASVTVTAGSNLTYVLSATNSPVSYTISALPAGLTANPSTGTISGIPTVPGLYAVTISANNLAGTGPALVLALTVAPNDGTPNPGVSGSRIVNLSSRAYVGTGDDVLIVGFVITGTDPKPVMIRGVGPTLVSQNVSNALPDPVLDLYQKNTVIGNNDNWANAGNPATIAAEATRLGAFALPAGSLDSVIYTNLQPGVYSAIVSGAGRIKTGVALVEIYDASTTYTAASPRLVDVSSRAYVGTGNNVLIAGFVISGDQPKQVLIRGVGPALLALNVPGALADPVLAIYQNGAVVKQNDNWGSDGDSAAVSTAAVSVGAGALTAGSKDAAILITLQPGVYSALLSGANGTTGVALLEVYEVDPAP